MKKKQITSIAAITLVTVLFSACGNTSTKPANNNNAPTETKKVEASQAPASKPESSGTDTKSGITGLVDYTGMNAVQMVEANAKADFKITDTPVTLSVMVNNTADHPGDMNEIPIFQKMEKRTNVKVDWVMPGASAFNEQRSLALATGDLPDIIINGLTNAEIAKYGADGTLMAYDALYETYPDSWPNIKRMYETYPNVKAYITAPDGHIYSTPRINEGAWMKQDGNQIINKEWLDNLNIPMPKDVNEYKAALKAFKTEDPNKNGRNDEIPLLINANTAKLQGWQGINFLMASFGVISNNDFRMMVNGVAECSATQPGWKEGVKYLNDLYNEGLIDPESFTIDGAQYTAKLAADPPSIGSAQVWSTEDQVAIPNATEIYSYLPPLKGPNGENPTIYAFYAPGWDRSGSVISADTKYPEVSLKWVDYLYDTINSLEMIEGEFNQRLELVSEGYYIIGDPPAGMAQGQYRYKNSPGHSGAWAVFAPEYDNVLRLTFTDAKVKFNKENCEPYYDPNPFKPVFYTYEESQTMATLNNDIINEIARQTSDWILNGGVETGFDAFTAKLDAIGLQDWLKINRDALERYGK